MDTHYLICSLLKLLSVAFSCFVKSQHWWNSKAVSVSGGICQVPENSLSPLLHAAYEPGCLQLMFSAAPDSPLPAPPHLQSCCLIHSPCGSQSGLPDLSMSLLCSEWVSPSLLCPGESPASLAGWTGLRVISFEPTSQALWPLLCLVPSVSTEFLLLP